MHWCNATNLSAQSLALVASSAFIKHVNAMSNSSPHDVSLNGFTQGHSKACFILSSTEGRCAPFSMASAMPSSAAAVEGLEEGDALDVSSLSLSLAFLREDMFKMSSSGFVLQKVRGLCRKLEPSRICVTLKTKSV